MAFSRLSIEKRCYIISALVEGTPINAVCRMFKVGKHAVLRVIRETGAALADYQHRTFRNLPCKRLALDEQWQYIGCHGQRMEFEVPGKGDYWLWCALDPDTKLVVSFKVDRRDWTTGEYFIEDLASRVTGPVQIATNNAQVYGPRIRAFFGEQHEGYTYGMEKKHFEEPFNRTEWNRKRKNGVAKICRSERTALIGKPNLRTLTTSHIERVFLSVRQELARFGRLTLAYSKKLSMHRLAVAMHFGVYNLVRKHTSLDGQTPAQAAGLEEKRWIMEDVVALTEDFMRRRLEARFEAAWKAKHGQN